MKNVLLVVVGVGLGFVGTCSLFDMACDEGLMEWKYYNSRTGKYGHRGNVELPAEKED